MLCSREQSNNIMSSETTHRVEPNKHARPNIIVLPIAFRICHSDNDDVFSRPSSRLPPPPPPPPPLLLLSSSSSVLCPRQLVRDNLFLVISTRTPPPSPPPPPPQTPPSSPRRVVMIITDVHCSRRSPYIELYSRFCGSRAFPSCRIYLSTRPRVTHTKLILLYDRV